MYRKEYTERKHVIDFLFPLALFFALAASSVALVILASGSYSVRSTPQRILMPAVPRCLM